VLSTVRATLEHDTRDHPFLPTRGWHAAVTTEVGLLPFGSAYFYQRAEVAASHWWRLPWNDHVLRLEMFAGAIAGDAPSSSSTTWATSVTFCPHASWA